MTWFIPKVRVDRSPVNQSLSIWLLIYDRCDMTACVRVQNWLWSTHQSKNWSHRCGRAGTSSEADGPWRRRGQRPRPHSSKMASFGRPRWRSSSGVCVCVCVQAAASRLWWPFMFQLIWCWSWDDDDDVIVSKSSCLCRSSSPPHVFVPRLWLLKWLLSFKQSAVGAGADVVVLWVN